MKTGAFFIITVVEDDSSFDHGLAATVESREAGLSRKYGQDYCDYEGKWFTVCNGHTRVSERLGSRRLSCQRESSDVKAVEKYGYFTVHPSPPNLNSSTTGTKLGKEVAVIKEASQVLVVDGSDMSEPEIKLTPAEKEAAAIKVYTWRDLPLPSWITRISDLPLDFRLTCTIYLTLTMARTTLLIVAAGLDENAWYLLAVGTIVAGIRRRPEKHGIHLKKIHTEGRKGKVMNVLMVIKSAYSGKNIGRSLVMNFSLAS